METILVLNSLRYGQWQPAMLLHSEGEQKELICFERDDTTEAYYSCSINWNNQLFIFGGDTHRRQISRLGGHKLERVGSLDFDHRWGACTVMANKFVYLCFAFAVGIDSNDWKQCRRSTGPLEPFSEVALSTYDHGFAQTSSSDTELVAVAGSKSKKSEKLENDVWSDIEEPPVDGTNMYEYAVISKDSSHYYAGGYIYGKGHLNSILRLQSGSWTWSNVGQMNSARRGHAVIWVGEKLMIIGGFHTKNNEACFRSNNGDFYCEKLSSSLSSYFRYPILFSVADNYGSC